MTNLKIKRSNISIIKQAQNVKLSKVSRLESINIFSIPNQIKNDDINAMFNGLLRLIKDSYQQEQNEKYLKLKLQYSKLQYLYNK
ncbi:MAG: hypothetical protein J6R61_06925, partial [Bacteroidales bacterium]|nr:hypothetical protein [Bacteroidales bacterium]